MKKRVSCLMILAAMMIIAVPLLFAQENFREGINPGVRILLSVIVALVLIISGRAIVRKADNKGVKVIGVIVIILGVAELVASLIVNLRALAG